MNTKNHLQISKNYEQSPNATSIKSCLIHNLATNRIYIITHENSAKTLMLE